VILEKESKKWKNKFGGNTSRIGDVVEYSFCTRLLKQGFEVFKNMSCTGDIDVITYEEKTNLPPNELLFIDIKTYSKEAMKNPKHLLSVQQREKGIKVGYMSKGCAHIVFDKEIIKI
tara:strand:+ start:752 stop:1102 length:351 start_codon:yes stop_codon:yes gene_type:complete